MVIERDRFAHAQPAPQSEPVRRAIDQGPDRDCLISITNGDPMDIGVAADLGVASATRLREALEVCLERNPATIRLDGRGIDRVSVAGLVAIGEAFTLCRDRGIQIEFELSASERQVLDAGGLWWLGVIDDGPPLEEVIWKARSAYEAFQDVDAAAGAGSRDEGGNHG